jgi:predicted RNase H-like HicB family nuclease
MNNEITIRYFNSEDGYIIAKAVGYPGFIAFGKTMEQIESRINEAFRAMAQFNAIKTIGNPDRPIYSGGSSNEKNIRLQAV